MIVTDIFRLPANISDMYRSSNGTLPHGIGHGRSMRFSGITNKCSHGCSQTPRPADFLVFLRVSTLQFRCGLL